MSIIRDEVSQGYRFYDDTESDLRYGRIVMGVVWPRVQGCACVVAAGLHEEAGTTQKPYYVLAEIALTDWDQFMHQLIELKEKFQVEVLYARQDETYDKLRHMWQFQNYDLPRLYVSTPMFSETDRIEYHVNLVKNKLTPRKLLHFSEQSKLPGQLAGIPTDISKITCDDHPAVAALGFAVAGLNAYSGGAPRMNAKEIYGESDYFDNPLG